MKLACLFLIAAFAAVGARAAELPLRIDAARSRVDIVVKATVDSFTGKLDAYDAAIGVDPVTGEVRTAKFAFKFADVKTGKTDRDEQMHAWQDTRRHPDGVFTLAALSRGEGGQLVATGTLKLHDMAREISFPVAVAHEGGLFSLDGEVALDTRDFGLPIIKKFLLLKVEPEVRVRFHLQGGAVEAPARTTAP